MFGVPKPSEKPVPKDFPKGVLPRALPAIATHAYSPRDVLELELTLNQRLHITEAKGEWWYVARTMNGNEGWVPSSYIKLLAAPSSLNMQTTFKTWSDQVQAAFHPPKIVPTKENPKPRPPKLNKRTFPWLPPEVCACEENSCWLRKQNPTGIGACVHDVKTLLKGVGEDYNAGWVWKLSLGWHPDRFVKKFKDEFKEEGMGAVGEMFGILNELANKERSKEKAGKTRVVG